MLVRPEEPDDQARVRSLVSDAFGAGPGAGPGEAIADLVDALRHDDPDVLSLVAVEGGIAGHVMFSQALLDAPRRIVPVQTLSPLSVTPSHQGQGVGTALIRRGLDELDRRGIPLVFVEGDPGYYSRFGFAPAGEEGFRRPSLRIPDQAFQVIKLSAYEPWMTGTFIYAQTFWTYDCVGLRDAEA